MSIAQLVAQRNVVQGYAAKHLVKLLAPPIIRLHGWYMLSVLLP